MNIGLLAIAATAVSFIGLAIMNRICNRIDEAMFTVFCIGVAGYVVYSFGEYINRDTLRKRIINLELKVGELLDKDQDKESKEQTIVNTVDVPLEIAYNNTVRKIEPCPVNPGETLYIVSYKWEERIEVNKENPEVPRYTLRRVTWQTDYPLVVYISGVSYNLERNSWVVSVDSNVLCTRLLLDEMKYYKLSNVVLLNGNVNKK